MAAVDIDALYAAVVETLPSELQAAACELPFTLKLAPAPTIPWSEVFNHEVTLQAPALFAEAMPRATPTQIRDAVLAHMLAVIEAFGNDRIQDGQIKTSSRLHDLLAYLRLARDRSILRLTDELDPFATADRETRDAILAERALLNRAEVSTFPHYEAISLGKQSVGFPATLALARAAGLEKAEIRLIERTLACVWLGLQFEDDVLDWEDDWRQGGAWVVCLARGARVHFRSNERPTVPNALQRFVLETNVLPRMLGLARRKYRAVRRRAMVLGARKLASWAEQRERHAASLARMEMKHAGYVLRMQRLAPWASVVLR
jgi:hypothetical protein